VLRINDSKAVRVIRKLNIEEKRGAGRPTKKLRDGIESDKLMGDVSEREVRDQALGRCRTRLLDPI